MRASKIRIPLAMLPMRRGSVPGEAGFDRNQAGRGGRNERRSLPAGLSGTASGRLWAIQDPGAVDRGRSKRGDPSMQGFVALDGVEIAYHEWGKRDDTIPVVLHHG